MKQKIIFRKQSQYQLIEIIEDVYYGRMLFLDKDLQISERDAYLYNQAIVLPVAKVCLNHVAILGGGDGGVLYELLSHNPKHVDLVEIDKDVILSSKKYLQSVCHNSFNNSCVNIIIINALQYLKHHNPLDAIIVDLTTHPKSSTSNNEKDFYDELFLRIKRNLKNDGRISLQCCSSSNHETYEFMRIILAKHFSNIDFRDVFIPSFAEKWAFASGKR